LRAWGSGFINRRHNRVELWAGAWQACDLPKRHHGSESADSFLVAPLAQPGICVGRERAWLGYPLAVWDVREGDQHGWRPARRGEHGRVGNPCCSGCPQGVAARGGGAGRNALCGAGRRGRGSAQHCPWASATARPTGAPAGQRIRVAPSVLAAGSIICSIGGADFEPVA